MSLFLRRLCILFLAGLSIPCIGYAKPVLETSFSTESAYLSEPIHFQIDIEWSKSEGPFTFAVAELPLLNLEIITLGESNETFLKDSRPWARKTFQYELKALDTGEALIRGMAIPYVSTSGSDHGELVMPSTQFSIHQDPVNPGKMAALIGIPAGTLFIGSFIFALIKRRGSRKATANPSSLEDQYIQKIQDLTKYVEAPESKQALYEVSVKLKAFLGEFYGLQSVSITEDELIRKIEAREPGNDEIARLKELLSSLHDAKFSGESISTQQFSELNDKVIRYIESKKVRGISPGG